MTQELAYATGGMVLFCVGLAGVFFGRHLLRRLMGANVMALGVFMLLMAIARRNADPYPDPVPHAMLLTGIVVAISATAFAIGLARRWTDATGRTDLDEQPGDEL